MPRTRHGGVPCPECGANSWVRDSRVIKMEDGSRSVRRRRNCLGKPAHSFTTHEVVAIDQVHGASILESKARRLIRERLERLIRDEFADKVTARDTAKGA